MTIKPFHTVLATSSVASAILFLAVLIAWCRALSNAPPIEFGSVFQSTGKRAYGAVVEKSGVAFEVFWPLAKPQGGPIPFIYGIERRGDDSRETHSVNPQYMQWENGLRRTQETWPLGFVTEKYPRINTTDESAFLIGHVTALFVPYWAILTATAILPILLLRRRHKLQMARFRKQNSRCVNCGYDLRASRDRCPECGVATKPSDERTKRIS